MFRCIVLLSPIFFLTTMAPMKRSRAGLSIGTGVVKNPPKFVEIRSFLTKLVPELSPINCPKKLKKLEAVRLKKNVDGADQDRFATCL